MNDLNFTKRQHTEIHTRQDTILTILSDKFNIKRVGISFKDRNIYFGDDEIIFGYFIDYKTVKQLQLNIIKILNTVDYITDGLQDKVNSIKSKRL